MKTDFSLYQTRLAIEMERVIEFHRKYERERARVTSLEEQADVERSHANTELMNEQGKNAELTAWVRNLEKEKERLLRVVSMICFNS